MVLNVQVRIRVRAERDALDEESFRSILDYEGQAFKLDLNAHQVDSYFQAEEIPRAELITSLCILRFPV